MAGTEQSDGALRAPTVGVLGAGAIGTFLGALLSSASVPVIMVGRTDDPSALADVDICLVCVKAPDTEPAAETLRAVFRGRSPRVVSMQSGLSGAELLAHHLERPVAAGVMGFEVRSGGAGRRRTVRPGPLWLEAGDERLEWLAATLTRAGQPTRMHSAIGDVMRGRALLATQDGLAGATGLCREELLYDADARWCYAQCIREGLAVFSTMGVGVAKTIGPGPRVLASMLGLPDVVARPLLASFMSSTGDGDAVTSLARDLRRGRATEIEHLNGHLAELGACYGVPTPVNRLIAHVVRQHEGRVREGGSPRWWSAAALRAASEREQASTPPRARGPVIFASRFVPSTPVEPGHHRP